MGSISARRTGYRARGPGWVALFVVTIALINVGRGRPSWARRSPDRVRTVAAQQLRRCWVGLERGVARISQRARQGSRSLAVRLRRFRRSETAGVAAALSLGFGQFAPFLKGAASSVSHRLGVVGALSLFSHSALNLRGKTDRLARAGLFSDMAWSTEELVREGIGQTFGSRSLGVIGAALLGYVGVRRIQLGVHHRDRALIGKGGVALATATFWMAIDLMGMSSIWTVAGFVGFDALHRLVIHRRTLQDSSGNAARRIRRFFSSTASRRSLFGSLTVELQRAD